VKVDTVFGPAVLQTGYSGKPGTCLVYFTLADYRAGKITGLTMTGPGLTKVIDKESVKDATQA
jgi:hypothetical protein